MLYILKVREKDRSSNKFMNSMTSLSLSHSHVSCLYWNKALCFTHPLGSHFLSTTLITTSQREFDTYQKSGYHSEHIYHNLSGFLAGSRKQEPESWKWVTKPASVFCLKYATSFCIFINKNRLSNHFFCLFLKKINFFWWDLFKNEKKKNFVPPSFFFF